MVRPSDIAAALAGAAGGVIATGPMSVVMLAGGRLPRYGEQPPRRITTALLHRTGLLPRRRGERALVVAAAHVAYGAGAGVALLLAGRALGRPRPTPVAGALAGVALWAASYAGWVPAVGLLPPPWRDHPPRVASMIAAHVVWGAQWAWWVRRLSPPRQRAPLALEPARP